MRSNNRGFTLVELLVAAVLLATGLAAAAAAFSTTTRAQAGALRRTTEARLAEAKLAEIRATGITTGSGEGTFAEVDAGQAPMPVDLDDYRYRWEIATDQVQGLSRAQIQVWFRDNERDQFTLIWYLPPQPATTTAAP